MATDRAALAVPPPTAVPIPAVLVGLPTVARSRPVPAEGPGEVQGERHLIGYPSMVVSRLSKAATRVRHVRTVRARRTAVPRFNSVPTAHAATANVTISDRARTARAPVPTRPRAPSGCMVTTPSPPLWPTLNAASAA